MTRKEYTAILQALGLTQAGAARLLGVDERTSRKWHAGDRAIPAPVGRFLRFIAATGASPEEVMKALGEG